MGKGKRKVKVAADEEERSEDEISVEEGDIEALARSTLKAGEVILGEGKKAEEVESRGVCNAPLILQKVDDIEYKVPAGAKRVPWVDTLCIDGWRDVPKDVKAKDGVKLEGAFMEIAGDAVKEAYRRFSVMKVPCSRPTDFYAEMLRTDSQMYKVRARAAEEQRRIKIVEQRKSAQSAKKFAKEVRSKRLEDKAGQKRQTLENIAQWKSQRKQDGRNADEKDLDDILNKQQGQRKRKNGEDGDDQDEPSFQKKKKGQPSKKQIAKDKKWGHGGKKKRSKQNTSESLNDDSRFRKKKGKGKGKGGGGGKGKGKGGGGKRRRRG